MFGQIYLAEALKSLKVSCDGVEYAFASVSAAPVFDDRIVGMFREKEGVTVIAAKSYFDETGVKYQGSYAKLTLDVQTSLETVGLTAEIASRLSKHNIAANVISGYYHEHIFVQYRLRQNAMGELNSLSGNGPSV